MSTVYLWTYDQTPYIIPIVWIVGTLVERTKKYIHAFLFLILLDTFTIFAATQLSATHKDLWGFGTTFLIFGATMTLWVTQINKNADIEGEST